MPIYGHIVSVTVVSELLHPLGRCCFLPLYCLLGNNNNNNTLRGSWLFVLTSRKGSGCSQVILQCVTFPEPLTSTSAPLTPLFHTAPIHPSVPSLSQETAAFYPKFQPILPLVQLHASYTWRQLNTTTLLLIITVERLVFQHGKPAT